MSDTHVKKTALRESAMRSVGLVVFCFIVLLLILMRLFFVQVVRGGVYRAQAERMYNNTPKGSSERGDIVMITRDGKRYTLAGQTSVYHLHIEPRMLKDQGKAIVFIQKLYPGYTKQMLGNVVTKAKNYRFKDEFTEDQIHRIFAITTIPEGPAGVRLATEKKRYYPGDSLASHVLGFVGYVGDSLEGRYGLEKQYNSILKIHDQGLYTNFFIELFSNFKSISQDAYNSTGQGTLITTLEPEVQKRTEQLLDKIVEKWQPDEGGIIVMNPSTGQIVAMAGTPSFNVNEFQKVQNSSDFTNPLVQKVFEVGSIMKPLIMAYGIETGKITPQTTYTDKGSVVVDDRTIYNFDKKARGKVNMEQVLIQSLNTGMVFIMDKLPRKDVRDYLTSLGLRGETGIDLPYESTGLTKNLDTLRRVEYANIAFGQGIAVTPIAIMRALSVLANGGAIVTPHVVSAIEYPHGATIDLSAEHEKNTKQILSPQTVNTVTDMMVKLVDTNFVNDPNYLKHYSVAAKTGTAQIASAAGAGYGVDRLHTFFGFFPAHKPQFSVFMMITRPQGVKYSAQTLAGPFLELTQFLVNYYSIPPDRGFE